MIQIKDEECRNLQEQVEWLTIQINALKYGLNVVRQVKTVAELPSDINIGEAVAVGDVYPYFFYIKIGEPKSYINVGTLAGPKGDTGSEGQKGATGEKGSQWLYGYEDPTEPAKENDMYLNSRTGVIFSFREDTWYPIINISGPQGPIGQRGVKGDTGPIGPKGDKGEPSAPLIFLGTVAEPSLLPDAYKLPRNSAYFVGTQQPFYIYVIEGITTLTWKNLGSFNLAHDFGNTKGTAWEGDKGQANADNITDLQNDVNHISGVDIPNLENDKENVATSIIQNAPTNITNIQTFYTTFYEYRKSAQRKYLIEGGTSQNPTNESIITALGGYPKGFQHKEHWAMYVELPIDYSGGFTVRVKLIGSNGNDFYERSIKGWNGGSIVATEWNNYYMEKQNALPQQDLDNIAMINQYAENIMTNTSDITLIKSSITDIKENKQNKLIAGDNITIVEDTISSTGGSNNIEINSLHELDNIKKVGEYHVILNDTNGDIKQVFNLFVDYGIVPNNPPSDRGIRQIKTSRSSFSSRTLLPTGWTDWFTSEYCVNGSTIFSANATYPLGAIIRYRVGSVVACYVSIKDLNKTNPADNPENWIRLDTALQNGGGTNVVVANNGQEATTPLETLLVGDTNYQIPAGGGGGIEKIWSGWADVPLGRVSFEDHLLFPKEISQLINDKKKLFIIGKIEPNKDCTITEWQSGNHPVVYFNLYTIAGTRIDFYLKAVPYNKFQMKDGIKWIADYSNFRLACHSFNSQGWELSLAVDAIGAVIENGVIKSTYEDYSKISWKIQINDVFGE